jgi:hypothetical protein
MKKKEKKPNVLKKILDSQYYDHHESSQEKRSKRLPVDEEVDRLKSNSPGTY